MALSWKERARKSITDPSHLVIAVLIGAASGSAIVAFLAFTEWMHGLLFGRSMPVWMRPLMPAAAALIGGYLLLRLFPDARGSGIPQTRAAMVAGDGYISMRTVIGKFVCCAISLGGGVALGREGPSVQMGAGIASFIARKTGMKARDVQALAPVGAAAALAAAFNTPMAAVLFTLEELVGDLNARALGPVVIGAATSWMTLHVFLGDEPLFRVPAYHLVHPSELAFYAILGVAGALVSVAFSVSLLRLRTWFRKWPRWTAAVQPATGGLTAGLLALYSADVLGAGYAAVELAMHGKLSGTSMCVLLAFKLIATVACYSSGNAGGIFGPSLFFGAMLGGAFGSVVHQWFPATTAPPGAYALVGMGATFAGVIRTPLTSVVMIFELTRDYTIIVPLMISNLAAYAVARAIFHMPIYEALAQQDGVRLPHAVSQRPEAQLRVGDAMRSPAPMLDPRTTLAAARELIPAGDCLVGSGGRLEGIVRGSVLDNAIHNGQSTAVVATFTQPVKIQPLHPDDPAEIAMHRLGKSDLTVVPVVDRRDQTVVLGQISFEDVLDAYRNQED